MVTKRQSGPFSSTAQRCGFVMRSLYSALLIAGALTLGGCSKKEFNLAECESGLKVGMTLAEVQRVCGVPIDTQLQGKRPYAVYMAIPENPPEMVSVEAANNIDRVVVKYEGERVVSWDVRRQQ